MKSGQGREAPRTGNGRDAGTKPDTRDCAQQDANGDIQWKATETTYPHRGGLDGSR